MCALNFTKFRFPLAVKASFCHIYLELPLESPINMSINRNTIILSSKLTCPTPNCYLDTLNKLPDTIRNTSFCPPSCYAYENSNFNINDRWPSVHILKGGFHGYAHVEFHSIPYNQKHVDFAWRKIYFKPFYKWSKLKKGNFKWAYDKQNMKCAMHVMIGRTIESGYFKHR